MNSILKTIVLIPTYNERDNIRRLVPAILAFAPEISILVIDDNSPDGTGKAVQELARTYPNVFLLERKNNRGFGRSYLEGFSRVIDDAKYETIVMMDSDFSHDPATIPALLAKIPESDAVFGSRYIPGGGVKNWALKRVILSRFANFYARTILNCPVRDLTTGFMSFKKSALKGIELGSIRSDGYAFLVELKYRLMKNKCRVVESPIIFCERREGQSKMSARVIWESIWLPWRIRFLQK